MRTSHRIIISVVLVAASASLAYWVSSFRHREPEEDAAPQERGAHEAVVSSPELRHTEGGKLAWKVILDEIQLDRGGTTVAAQGLREGIIYDKGEPALRVTAQHVRGDTTRRNFHVSGRVVVTSPKGFIIKTENVDWFNDEQRIHCPGAVLMKAKSIVISTTGLDYLLQTDIVNCPNQVRMHSGNNQVIGRSLTYDVKTEIVDMTDIQMVINPDEGKRILKEWNSR